MATSPRADPHLVFNQSPELAPWHPLERDRTLQATLALAGLSHQDPRLQDYSRRVGGELAEAGRQANRHTPVLRSHDRRGYRINAVEFHPAYHQLMTTARASGWPTLPWREDVESAHSLRAALAYLHHHADPGTGCPLTMTFAGLPPLRHNPALLEAWRGPLVNGAYDPGNRPWYDKGSLTLGMGMTEKQGGTDVRANTSAARFTGDTSLGPGYEITGHKWFMSAPMSDGFLVLAQAKGGLSCFLMPRWRADGELNGLHFLQLKDKLGNRSNASSEVEFRNAFAWRLGEEGRGIATIIEMVALTRFDCAVGSAALMRRALVEAIHHCRHREVAGRLLVHQPLMTEVLADLAVISEAATHLAMRLARALDAAPGSDRERAFLRLATPIAKYWNCRMAPGFIYEAMECLGGNGYVEDGPLPLLYREAPVNAIWEGSGNVQCLDVLRALDRDGDSLEAVLAEVNDARGLNKHYDRHCRDLALFVDRHRGNEAAARLLVEKLAGALQGALLLRHGPAASAQRFCEHFPVPGHRSPGSGSGQAHSAGIVAAALD